MSFIWVDLLWLLFVVPLAAGVYLLLQRRRRKYAVRYASLALVREAAGRGPGFRRHIPPVLFLVGLTVLLLAVARPQATVVAPSNQGTVILTFDVSGSMRANDVKPSRLEAAKEAGRDFVAKQSSKVRIGVVAFSDTALVVQEPTTDREAVLAAINRLAPQRRTAIGSAIITSLNTIFEGTDVPLIPVPESGFGGGPVFQPAVPTTTSTPAPVAPGSYTSAVIVLLSDGQSNIGPAPLDVVGDAADRGVRIYTVGLGSPEGTVLRAGGFGVRVRLDEATLKAIAQQTGGQYFNAQTESDLSGIYRDLSTRLTFKPQQTEITAWFAAFAVVVFFIAGLLSMLWFSRLV